MEALDGQTEQDKKKQAVAANGAQLVPRGRQQTFSSQLESVFCFVIHRAASDDVTPELCWLPAQPAELGDVGNAHEHCCKTPTGSAE